MTRGLRVWTSMAGALLVGVMCGCHHDAGVDPVDAGVAPDGPSADASSTAAVADLAVEGPTAIRFLVPPTVSADYFSEVLLGDFNADGRLDLVTTNYGQQFGRFGDEGGVRISLGVGDGTFRPPAFFPTGYGALSMAAGDFNGDHRLDLAVVNVMIDNLSVLLGNGDGTFKRAVHFDVGEGPAEIATGDFNRDGRLDLAVANVSHLDHKNFSVVILIGSSDGNFKAHAPLSTPSEPRSLAVSDFDGDGRDDLVVGSVGQLPAGGPVQLHRSNPDGTLGEPTILLPQGGYGALCLHDFDGDGQRDLVVVAGDVLFLRGRGGGVFDAAITSPHPRWGGALGLAAGDFDGDRKPDLAILTGGLFVLAGDGAGHFRAGPGWSAGAAPSGLAVGDLDGDHRLDAVVSDTYAAIFLGRGDGTFPASRMVPVRETATSSSVGDFDGDRAPDVALANATSITTLTAVLGAAPPVARRHAAGWPVAVTTADFDGDGALDLFAAGHGGGAFLEGDGRGAFRAASSVGFYGAGSMAVADLDGDGTLELIAAGDSDDIALFGWQRDGMIERAPRLSVKNPAAVAVADFDGDGKLDIAAATFPGAGESVMVFRGGGDGRFGAALSSAGGGVALVVADFDEDGHRDVATVRDRSIVVHRGNGDATFAKGVEWQAGGRVGALVAADLDKDGHVDIAWVQPEQGLLGVRAGRGDATFGAAGTRAVGKSPQDLVTGDFDGDGWPDLATASYDAKTISLLRGAVGGVFLPRVDYPTSEAPAGLLAVDLHGARRHDLVVGSGGIVEVHEGKQDGTLGAPARYLGGAYPTAFVAGDLNHDGRVDLVAATSARLHGPPGSLATLLGEPGGGLRSASPIDAAVSADAVAASDFDGDGRPDVVLAGSEGVQLLLGRGDGTFLPTVPRGAGVADSHQPRTLAVGDLDGDGIADVVVTAQKDGSVLVFPGRKEAGLADPIVHAIGGEVLAAGVGDFDGDGHPDLWATRAGKIEIESVILSGRGDGTFAEPSVVPGTARAGTLIAIGRFNRDPWLDVCLAYDDGVNAFAGRGAGAFSAPSPSRLGGLSSGPATVAEFDGDGRPDLLLLGGYQVTLLMNATP